MSGGFICFILDDRGPVSQMPVSEKASATGTCTFYAEKVLQDVVELNSEKSSSHYLSALSPIRLELSYFMIKQQQTFPRIN